MQRYEEIESGISNHDLETIREAIGNICYLSRNFSSGEFDEAIRYVESKGINIKEDTLVGDLITSEGQNTYTDEDFERAVFELKENFCDERIQDVKSIGKKLYSDKSIPNSQTNNSEFFDGTSPNVQSPTQKNSIKLLIIGAAAVIIVILLLLIVL